MTEPSEAAMREARELLERIVGKPYELHVIAVAEALDRHAAAEQERCIEVMRKAADNGILSWNTVQEIAAAIRSAP